ncbi:MAG: glycosyltransferase family 1 protein, partial [Anaerolineae bacterium]|nr:glycosyltransferase family 1 protein [Anaerolineae bacterium]
WQLSDPPWQPDADLLAFLEAGSKPVFIGFGSMIAPDSAALTRTVIEAVERSGQRAILSGGWGDLGAQDLPPTMRRIEYVPYRWLFSRMAAVIHHGGSGTTGLALSSGVPSMVVAFGTEQLYWGGRIAVLSVGLPPLFVKRLDTETLAERIRALVSDDGMRERAAALGARLRTEDGIGAAVGVVRGVVGS